MKLQTKNDKRKNLIIVIIAVVVALALIAGIISLIVFIGNKTPVDSTGIISIVLSSVPDKTSYYIGESFDPIGAKIEVIMKNDTGYHLVDYARLSFSGFDSTTAGEKTITVSYKGFTTTFTVTVKERPTENPVVTDVEIVGFQDTYTLEFWNKYGPQVSDAKVNLIYSDGSTQDGPWVQSTWVFGYTKLDAPGTTTVTIKYDTGAQIIEKVITITITN